MGTQPVGTLIMSVMDEADETARLARLQEYDYFFKRSVIKKNGDLPNVTITLEKVSKEMDTLSVVDSEDHISEAFLVLRMPQINLDIEQMKVLNVQSELLINRERFYGLKDKAGLESVLALTNQAAFGREYHPTLVDKAAHLWYSIATKQLFSNGNKRTALLAARYFLNINLVYFKIQNVSELYNVSLNLANGSMSVESLQQYIRHNAVLDVELMRNSVGAKNWPAPTVRDNKLLLF